MYFHTDRESDVNWLGSVFATAAHEGRAVRIDVTEAGELRLKMGGAWTAPLVGSPDMSRDASFANIVPAKDYSEGMSLTEVFTDLVNMDATARLDRVLRSHYSKVIQEGIDHA